MQPAENENSGISPVKPSNTIEDTMAVLNLGRKATYREIKEGRLLTFMIGGRRYVSGEALLQFIRDREEESRMEQAS